MAFLNRPRDYSKRPPVIPIIPGVLSVLDTPSIDLTYNTPLGILQADLNPVLLTPGTYGSSTMIPVFTVNQYGQIIDITEVAVSGGGGSYTVDNALIENPTGNFQLGGQTLGTGNLIRDTYITNDGNILRIDQDLGNTLYLNNTALSSGVGLLSIVNNGIGVRTRATQGVGIESLSFTDYSGEFFRSGSTTNDILGVIEIGRNTSGIGATGLGASIDWFLETSTTTSVLSNRIESFWLNATHASRLSGFRIKGVNGATENDLLTLSGNGLVTLNKYGIGSFTDTLAYALGVNSNGDIIEFTPGSSSVLTDDSVQGDGTSGNEIKLVNDEATPSANKYYGTDSSSTKGYHPMPPTAAIYPYQLRNYYRAYFPFSMVLYGTTLHVCYNASPSTGGNNAINTSTTDSLNTVTFASGMYNQVINITGSDEIWATSSGLTTIQRLVASTGAFIANTAITGVLTASTNTRFIQFDSSKVFIANATNFAALNSSYVTSSLTAHGLGSIPYFAVNNNGSSAQNGRVMLVGTNGLVLVNGSTNAITVTVTTLSGAIGSTCDVIYDSVNDKWILMTTVSGNTRIVYLTPATATTFTVFETITEFTSLGITLTPGTALPGKLLIDTARNYLFAVVNGTIQQYVLTTGELIKSLNYRMASLGTVSSAAIDTTNRQLYVTSANGNLSIITQFQYE